MDVYKEVRNQMYKKLVNESSFKLELTPGEYLELMNSKQLIDKIPIVRYSYREVKIIMINKTAQEILNEI